MKPVHIKTKIFLDSGDPMETKEARHILGFLDGQTTNPTLIAKNPYAQKRFEKGEKFTESEMWDFYKQVIQEISPLVSDVSIEIFADRTTNAEEIIAQARSLYQWVPNGRIKVPITKAGLAAVEVLVREGILLNMTLCFTQEQAAAVHAAARGAEKGQVVISPFMGRLDDLGFRGVDVVENIMKMYRTSHSPVEVLAASIRHMNHFSAVMKLGVDIVTLPLTLIKEWALQGLIVPTLVLPNGVDFSYDSLEKKNIFDDSHLTRIVYHDFDLKNNWNVFNIDHELTESGLQRFSKDWNNLIV